MKMAWLWGWFGSYSVVKNKVKNRIRWIALVTFGRCTYSTCDKIIIHGPDQFKGIEVIHWKFPVIISIATRYRKGSLASLKIIEADEYSLPWTYSKLLSVIYILANSKWVSWSGGSKPIFDEHRRRHCCLRNSDFFQSIPFFRNTWNPAILSVNMWCKSGMYIISRLVSVLKLVQALIK